MKKLLLLAACVGLFASAQAQSYVMKSTTTGKALDTVVNTGIRSQFTNAIGYQKATAIQAVLSKISGTAAGVVRLKGSANGVNYVRINPTDSLIVSDVATQSKIFTIIDNPYPYLMIEYTGAGTQSVKLSSITAARRP